MGLDARFSLAIISLLMLCMEADIVGTVTCPQPFSMLADEESCQNYVQCVYGTPRIMPCPPGLGFSEKIRGCVFFGQSDCNKPKDIPVHYEKSSDDQRSNNKGKNKEPDMTSSKITQPTTTPLPTTVAPTITDKTTTTIQTTKRASPGENLDEDDDEPTLLRMSIEEECDENRRARFSHPTECALYYDCSIIHKPIPKYFEQFMVECPYLQLYNERTKRCESHKNVKCGRRKEPKQACEYRQNWCQRAHCPPCQTRFPSCDGKPNGRNNWDGREWTPYFSECEEERLMEQGICEYNKGYPQLFSPESLGCVSIFAVPKQYGGYQPSCFGKKRGFYPDENGKCDVYFQCKNEEFRDTFQCPVGRRFDPASSLCKYPYEVEGPCRDESQRF